MSLFSFPPPTAPLQNPCLQTQWVWFVGGFTLGVMLLEFATPAAYIFGYLYTGSILLTSARLPHKWVMPVTGLAILLTLLNLWIPHSSPLSLATLANRSIAGMALLVTGVLSKQNRDFQIALAQQQTLLDTNRQLNSLREDFASTLTHDLKTPLLGAISTLTAFQQERFGPIVPNQAQVITMMIRSHSNSLQLLETLLDIYRNDTEGLTLKLAPVDLTCLVEEVARTLFDLAANRRVHLAFDFGDTGLRQSLWVLGDGLQLQRVFTNLLVNAISHSRRGERIEIVLTAQGDDQVVKFLDRGSGIAPEEFPHLFERFYQGQSDRQTKGTGLGLYLSRQIVEAHGGKIWAENRQTTGALFGIKLPRAATPYPPVHLNSHAPKNSID